MALIIPHEDQLPRAAKMLADELGITPKIKSWPLQGLKFCNKMPANDSVVNYGTIVTEVKSTLAVTLSNQSIRHCIVTTNSTQSFLQHYFQMRASWLHCSKSSAAHFGTLQGNTRSISMALFRSRKEPLHSRLNKDEFLRWEPSLIELEHLADMILDKATEHIDRREKYPLTPEQEKDKSQVTKTQDKIMSRLRMCPCCGQPDAPETHWKQREELQKHPVVCSGEPQHTVPTGRVRLLSQRCLVGEAEVAVHRTHNAVHRQERITGSRSMRARCGGEGWSEEQHLCRLLDFHTKGSNQEAIYLSAILKQWPN
ncbi:hypothetical protein J0S82_016394 [Galemys pyrenaicus]|uniref:Uncharacterized protein n=1 Tax=Galemys pyrenaicus TaxID=202257 RepID=A0A8J6DU19_GALPY|nr:hypothetical protein J0S82_016394 [Galemys pyrenaicus]